MLVFGRDITAEQRKDGSSRRMLEANGETTEHLIAQWRAYMSRHETIHASGLEQLEGLLRDQIAALRDAGLVDDEAFLIAVRRVGKTDAASREYAESFGMQDSWMTRPS